MAARLSLSGAMAAAAAYNPLKKKDNQPNQLSPRQLTNSYFSLASPAPAKKSEFVVELSWLAAGRWAPWGGARFLRSQSRQRQSTTSSIISFLSLLISLLIWLALLLRTAHSQTNPFHFFSSILNQLLF